MRQNIYVHCKMHCGKNMKTKEDANKLLDEIMKGVGGISIQLENLKALLGESIEGDGLRDFFESDVYARFHAFTEDSYHGEPPSDNDWSTLEGLFRMVFPHYYRLIAIDHHLTRDQLRLCLLIRLSFTPYAIKKVMDIDGARITRLKIQTNSRLFNERRARTLESNLKLHF